MSQDLGESEGIERLKRGMASGAAWSVFFSVVNKFSTLIAQYLLSWILAPAAFGQANIAIGFASPFGAIFQGPLATLLVQEKEDWERLARAAYGVFLCLSVAFSLVCVLLLQFTADSRTGAFTDPRLVGIMVLSWPVSALGLVGQAKMMKNMQFKKLAMIGAIVGTIQSVFSILAAFAGLRAAAIVLPLLIGPIFGTFLYLREAPIQGRFRWPRHLALKILRPVPWVFIVHAVNVFQIFGLGWLMHFFCTTSAIGLYTWGYAVASQSFYLFAANLNSVIFPVLVNASEGAEREAMLEKATASLLVVQTPVLVMQAIGAQWVIHHFFSQVWIETVPVIIFISLGLVTRPLVVAGAALMMARGAFGRYALISLVHVGILAAAVLVSSPHGSLRQVSMWSGAALFGGGGIYYVFAGSLSRKHLGKGMVRYYRIISINFLSLGCVLLPATRFVECFGSWAVTLQLFLFLTLVLAGLWIFEKSLLVGLPGLFRKRSAQAAA